MKSLFLTTIVLAALMVCVGGAVAQEEMSKDQWQQEMNQYTAMRNELSTKLKTLNDQITALRSQSTSLDADITKCMDELYALVGSNADLAAEYRKKIEAAENNANELMRLSDGDLAARSGEVDQLEATVKSLWENKLSLIPEFWDRLTALNEKIKSLRSTLAGAVKMYTVGTWSRDRDCLWNIAKKKDIYDNAWHWPKIWQGNRDQIKDPDVIHPGQKLMIPTKGEMTGAEKSAAKSYYSKKAGAQP
ncbi:MAG TPA: LysM peptidoglycan-binding domain-containing protein [Bacteroidota bacterium]